MWVGVYMMVGALAGAAVVLWWWWGLPLQVVYGTPDTGHKDFEFRWD